MIEQLLASPVFVPGVVSLLTAAIVAYLNNLGAFRKQRTDEATSIRVELREEIKVLRGEVRRLEQEVEVERRRYWEQVRATFDLQSKLSLMQTQLDDLRAMAGDRRRPRAEQAGLIVLPQERPEDKP